MSKNKETLTKAIAEKIVKASRPDNSEETEAALAQFSEIEDEAAEVLATKFALRAEFPKLQSLSAGAAQALGKMKNSWIVLDGLKSITPELARGLATGGALSLKGLKKLDKDTARELARHGCRLFLHGVEEASDEAVQALAETKAELSLDSLSNISDEALEKLIRLRGKKLVLGLTQLDEKQAKIIELFQGDYLALRSLTELSDAAAESLGRLSLEGWSGRLSLPNLQRFSEEAAKHLASQDRRLTLSGRLNISEAAFRALTVASNRQGSDWLLLSDWIELPDYAYEIVYTNSVANGKWAESGAGRSILDDDVYTVHGRVLTEEGAKWLTNINPLDLNLQSLPDNVAVVLAGHIGFLSVKTDMRPSLAALESLASRKYDKRFKGSGLQLGLKELSVEEASCLAKSACPLYLPLLRSISEEAVAVLANYKGDLHFGKCNWPGTKHAQGESPALTLSAWLKDGASLPKAAIKVLSKKQGTIDGEPAAKWAKVWMKACA